MATIEQVRTLVNDPAGASQIFDDPHYQTIIDIEDNVYRAGAAAARTLAAYYAAKVSIKAARSRSRTSKNSSTMTSSRKSTTSEHVRGAAMEEVGASELALARRS
jgi:hypothetical protein